MMCHKSLKCDIQRPVDSSADVLTKLLKMQSHIAAANLARRPSAVIGCGPVAHVVGVSYVMFSLRFRRHLAPRTVYSSKVNPKLAASTLI